MATEKEFLKQLGKKIANCRRKKNLSQTQLGDLVDMERSSVARLETGNSNATSLTLLKIGRALDVPVKKLFEFDL